MENVIFLYMRSRSCTLIPRLIFMTERPNMSSSLVWGGDSVACGCESNDGSSPNALPVAGARNICLRCVGLSHSGLAARLSSQNKCAFD